jgi:hypothetical protein
LEYHDDKHVPHGRDGGIAVIAWDDGMPNGENKGVHRLIRTRDTQASELDAE